MKNPILIIVGLLAFVYGCSSPEIKVEDAKQDLAEAKAALHQEKVDSVNDYLTFKAKMDAQIQANDIAIAAYKSHLNTSNKTLQKSDQKIIDELEQRNIDMRKKIDLYQENGKDKWAAFKTEFTRDMDNLGQALKNQSIKNTN